MTKQKILTLKVEESRLGRVLTSEEFEQNLGEVEIEGRPAMVHWGYGRTQNLGDFCSLRVDCGVELPCLPSEVPAMIQAAQAVVRGAITEFMQKSEKDTNSKPTF